MSSQTIVLQKASDALDKYRRTLLTQHFSFARGLWQTLSPADWWNDAVVAGISARVAMNYISVLAEARRAGSSYASFVLKSMGITADGSVLAFEYPRVNTDLWLVSARPSGSYRHEAVQTPDLRPDSWPKLGEEHYDTVLNWLNAALDRLEKTAEMDISKASNDAAAERYKRSGVSLFRRVIHPEMSTTGVCGLCVAAATRVYSKENLNGLHNRCKCTVAPVLDGKDPADLLNGEDLRRLYKNATGTSANALAQTQYKVVEHTELGSVLVPYERDRSDSARAEPPVIEDDSTRKQLERMSERVNLFASQANALEAKGESVTFRDSTRDVTFKPTDRLDESIKSIDALKKVTQKALTQAA